jgi:hypothetical protein
MNLSINDKNRRKKSSEYRNAGRNPFKPQRTQMNFRIDDELIPRLKHLTAMMKLDDKTVSEQDIINDALKFKLDMELPENQFEVY